ncbi:MAG: DNA/RNA nuclease SfsA [Betaproteobacteria bacterium]|nr:DNA/RNA nuclease SfsA [Betaproteobacteria bacterium]
MHFDPPLIAARLLRRYKRFLADVELPDGQQLTVVCPNTGSLLGCLREGAPVWLSHSASPTRKYAHTWEMVSTADGTRVGINTHIANALVREAIDQRVIPALQGYTGIEREVRYGREGSRIDLLLRSADRPLCYVEVKNVTAAVSDGVALFPDSVSVRASKHLRELINVVAEGARAVLVFCVQREDVDEVRPADAIDPVYGATLREALSRGVEAYAWRAAVSPEAIALTTRVPVICP